MAKHWSLTKTQLKPLSDAQLPLFCLRNGRRTARSRHELDRPALDEAEGGAVRGERRRDATDSARARSLVRAARDASALHINAAKGREESFERAMGALWDGEPSWASPDRVLDAR
jgi:hypothetical protein